MSIDMVMQRQEPVYEEDLAFDLRLDQERGEKPFARHPVGSQCRVCGRCGRCQGCVPECVGRS